VILADKHSLLLRTDVLIDVHMVGDWASRLISGRSAHSDLTALPRGIDPFDLLPGWYDDWVLLEREQLRQRILHALEVMSYHLAAAGRYAEAVDAAMMAVSAEPLRESAQQALLEAHLAEGNWVEGQRVLESYRELLGRELGVDPDPRLESMLLAGRPALRPCRTAPPVAALRSPTYDVRQAVHT
jgi:DNA-binding SARP family transcriptional activator